MAFPGEPQVHVIPPARLSPSKVIETSLTWNPLQIEGLITVLFGIMSYFMLPPFPQDYSANDRFSWLTPDEALYARLRTKYANGPHAPTYEFQWKDVIAAAKDRKTYFM
jgi:hypothetical protein